MQGRKIRRTAGVSPAITEYYVYDGNQIVADTDASGNLLRTYAYGPGIDNILSMSTYSGGTGSTLTGIYYYLKDQQNTVVALTDASGNVVESYDYDAYGRILDVKDGSGTSIANQKSAIGNRYTFQGREIDWDTGLMYFRARWYNPETGRWLSKDPIGIAGGMNLYVFVENNPVMFVDPSGHLLNGLTITALILGLLGALGAQLGGTLGAAMVVGGIYGVIAVGVVIGVCSLLGVGSSPPPPVHTIYVTATRLPPVAQPGDPDFVGPPAPFVGPPAPGN